MTKIHTLKEINGNLQQKFKGRKLVFGRGNDKAQVVFVGEAPDVHDEKEGKAFAGPMGKQLTQLLKSINLDSKNIYMTHALKYRPNPDKAPTLKEIKSNMPFLREELKSINPQVVVTLGTLALTGIGLKLPISNVHARVFNFGHYELLPTFHPNDAEKDPLVKPMINLAFTRLKELLEKKKKEAKEIQANGAAQV